MSDRDPVKRTDEELMALCNAKNLISGAGGALPADELLRNVLALYNIGNNERVLLVATGKYGKDQAVDHYIARSKRTSAYKMHVIEVDSVVIGRCYANPGKGGDRDKEVEVQTKFKELLKRAVEVGASDIHIIKSSEQTQIKFRIHNDLQVFETDTEEAGELLIMSIYALADMKDVSFKKNEPQNASYQNTGPHSPLPEGVTTLRVSTMPNGVNGTSMFLRLLYDDTENATNLNELGYSGGQRALIERLKKKPNGMILVCGPTGSGKSTTLKTILSELMRETLYTKNMLTIEDPVEYPIVGAIQSPVTEANTAEERKEAYAKHIRAAMRADPDIIMISEVRDEPTAEALLQAALTGHQLWSTLHTNSAIESITRLVDLGIKLSTFASEGVLLGMIFQRLLKKLCPHCKKNIFDIPKEELDVYSPGIEERLQKVINPDHYKNIAFKGDGCSHCGGTGIAGRVAVAEIICPDTIFFQHVLNEDRVSALRHWHKNLGGMTIMEHAVEKISSGEVDPGLAESVLGPLEPDSWVGEGG